MNQPPADHPAYLPGDYIPRTPRIEAELQEQRDRIQRQLQAAADRGAEGRRLQENLDREFRRALAAAIEGTGLNGRGLGACGMWDEMAGLMVPGAEGGWWVACGLVQETNLPSQMWETFLWAVYRSETENDPFEGSYPVDVKMTERSARDPRLLASMVVAAVTGSEAFTRDRTAADALEAQRRQQQADLHAAQSRWNAILRHHATGADEEGCPGNTSGPAAPLPAERGECTPLEADLLGGNS